MGRPAVAGHVAAATPGRCTHARRASRPAGI